jgi:predicted HTH domain antitoxin
MRVLKLLKINLDDEVLKLALAIQLFEEGKISLGKAAKVNDLLERTFGRCF